MISLEAYERLRKEMAHLLLGEDNSMDEDGFLFELPSLSEDPTCILGLAKKLKEEGNSFFKQNLVDDALEKYGYAGVVLTRHVSKKEDDIVSFFKLAICILLNLTACLSKQNEFGQVGYICSIILEFDNNNVKAMFRRALAAMKMGRKNWAYWDLLMAAEVEPKNKEILNKLEEVKNTINVVQKHHSQGVIPMGLGVGLSSPKKELSGNSGLEKMEYDGKVKNHVVTKGNEEWDSNPHVDGKEEVPCVSVTMEDKVTHQDSSLEEGKDMKGKIENIKASKEKVIEGVKDIFGDKKFDQAEPKCRFVNRNRPGSSLSISRKDIQALMKGKTLQYFNSRLGSPMTIRVVPGSSNDLKKKNESHEEMKSHFPSENDNQVLPSKMTRSNFPKSSDQGKEDIVMEDRVHEPTMLRSPLIIKRDWNFNVGAYNCDRNSFWKMKFKAAKRPKVLHKDTKKNAKANYVIATSSRSNYTFGCRYHIGMKRKDPPEATHHNRPRKHPSSCGYDSNLVKQYNSMSMFKCLGFRSKSVAGCVTHEVAVG